MNSDFRTVFVKSLLGIRGRVISLLTGLVIGFATKKLAEYNLTLTPEIEQLIVGGVAFGVMWVTDALALKYQAEGAKEIQEVLPSHVESDGVIGPVTVSAVKTAVEK